VFFTFVKPELSGRLRRRLELAFRDAGLDFGRFGIFLPWQDISAFRGLMKAADAMLDTIGFSGFNTAMQAVECDLPMVTRRGRFMRGRLASGILDRLGLQELAASTEEDYIASAVKFALEPDYRRSIRARVGKSRDSLYDDTTSIRALEEFLGEVTRR
jgi:predicted O-linked N-acetylglucosamine transferase (SPINDLY family)